MRFLIAFLLLLHPFSALAGEQVTFPYRLSVYYLEFFPYYYTDVHKEPNGLLLKKAERIFRKAEVVPVFQSMPAKRTLQELHESNPVASIGWFKTLERERFAQYSKPIYQNKPMEIIYLSQNDRAFKDVTTLDKLFRNNDLEIGMLEGYSYGQYVDDLVRREKPRVRFVIGGYSQLIGMLAAGRFDYILIAPEEVESLVGKSSSSTSLFKRRALSDLSSGNLRYILYSQGVPKAVVDRVDRAIESLGIVY